MHVVFRLDVHHGSVIQIDALAVLRAHRAELPISAMLFDIPNPDGAQGYDFSFVNTPNNAHAVVVCWDEMIRDTTEPDDIHLQDSRLERNVVAEVVTLGRL
jgi:hypothetical protein